MGTKVLGSNTPKSWTHRALFTHNAQFDCYGRTGSLQLCCALSLPRTCCWQAPAHADFEEKQTNPYGPVTAHMVCSGPCFKYKLILQRQPSPHHIWTVVPSHLFCALLWLLFDDLSHIHKATCFISSRSHLFTFSFSLPVTRTDRPAPSFSFPVTRTDRSAPSFSFPVARADRSAPSLSL